MSSAADPNFDLLDRLDTMCARHHYAEALSAHHRDDPRRRDLLTGCVLLECFGTAELARKIQGDPGDGILGLAWEAMAPGERTWVAGQISLKRTAVRDKWEHFSEETREQLRLRILHALDRAFESLGAAMAHRAGRAA